MRWGPLSLLNPVTNTQLANYALTTGSTAIDTIPTSEANFSLVPKTDFFGNVRPEATTDALFDPGAVEFGSVAPGPALSVTGGPLAFGNQAIGFASASRTLTLHNTGTVAGTGITLTFSSALFSRPAGRQAAPAPRHDLGGRRNLHHQRGVHADGTRCGERHADHRCQRLPSLARRWHSAVRAWRCESRSADSGYVDHNSDPELPRYVARSHTACALIRLKRSRSPTPETCH